MIVSRNGGVTLIGGGDLLAHDLEAALTLAPYLVAADGGAGTALALGHVPQATIGDLDSLMAGARAQLPKASIHSIAEQDSTDFEKCLREIESAFVLGVGFLGRRVDHSLAALNVLIRHDACPLVLIAEHDVVFAVHGQIHLELPQDTRVSLFPMAEVTGTSSGLAWPIDGIAFAPGGQSGTSNSANGPVTIEMDGPGMLMLLPRAHLVAALKGLGIFPRGSEKLSL